MRFLVRSFLTIPLLLGLFPVWHALAEPPAGEPLTPGSGSDRPTVAREPLVPPPLSPCSQSHDEDADGDPESITFYVYRQDGALTDTIVFDPISGPPHAWQHLSLDGEGRPLSSQLRQPPDEPPVKAARDCRKSWCSSAWIGRCVGRCTRDSLDRVVTMELEGGAVVRNDYGCWTTDGDAARYAGPTVDELLATTDGRKLSAAGPNAPIR